MSHSHITTIFFRYLPGLVWSKFNYTDNQLFTKLFLHNNFIVFVLSKKEKQDNIHFKK